MNSKENLIYKALKVSVSRERSYCKKVDQSFLEELNRRKPKTLDKIQDIWYKGNDGKAEKFAKITAKTIISVDGNVSNMGQNAYFYEAAEGIITAAIMLISEFCPPEKRHIISVFKLIQDLLAPSKVKGKTQFSMLI